MQLALGVVGAVIGGYFGGPMGAEAGFMIGSAIGGLLDPPKPPALHDLKIQSSAYGKFIPTAYGRYRLAGNVIWTSPVKQVTEDKKKAPTQAAIISMAVALCNGPVVSVRRIWANNKLVYDVSNPSNFKALSGGAQSLSNWTLYPGDENQTADPTMQSYLGAANTPAHRGLAYVVFNNLDLLQFGNVIPQFEFEVVTTPASAWYAQALTTWAAAYNTGLINACPLLTAQGGQPMGYAYYTGYTGLLVGQVSGYSALTQNLLHPSPPANAGLSSQHPNGNSDQAGMLAANGYYWYDTMGGAFQLVGFASGMQGLLHNTLWRNGNDLFISSAYGGSASYYIYRLELTGGTLAATSTRLGSWTIIGGSASYVYATNALDNKLYQLNRVTLAETGNTWQVGTSFSSASLGYVVDDDDIWMVLGGALNRFKPSTNTLTALGTCPVTPTSMAVVSSTMVVLYGNGQFGYMTATSTEANISLGSIVADVCNRAGLTSAQFDVSQLADPVKGYAVSSYSSGRNALDPLMSLYFFDAVDSEGKIKFIKRGGSPVATIPWSDLGVASNGGAASTDPIQETIVSESELPRSVTLAYKGAYSDYATASQRAFRSATLSNQDIQASVPVVMADDDAATRVQTYLWAAWTNRTTVTFGTPVSYLKYEPSDVVNLTDQDGTIYLLRLTKCTYDGKGGLTWEAVIENPSLYPNFANFVAAGGQPQGFVPQQIPYSGPSALFIIDGPPLRAQDANSYGVYVAACGYDPSWPGIVTEVSRDASSWSQLTPIGAAATMGTANNALANFGGGNVADENSSLSVTLFNGSLSSVSYTDFMNNVNMAWLAGEIIAFRNAVQTSANTYTLTGLLRGRLGTEAFMGGHAAGDQFVFLDPTKLVLEGLGATDYGSKLYWEYQLNNIFYSTPNPIVSKTIANAHVKPLSPALLAAGKGSASSSSDITLNWFRRARINGQWLNSTDVPLDESTESYQVQVFNGSTLVRTTTVAGPFNATNAQPSQYQGNPTWVYTAAMIAADGFSTGNTISFVVQQNSNQGVLGDAATTTITR
ncbi:phage tail protein [Paraburkholderia mimosarum]|uniref:phage tail protein n=1 Tax=Paraburkholderia mimosarum TaxID=312026 RepID=UPI0039C18762